MALIQSTLPTTTAQLTEVILTYWLQKYVALAEAEPLIGLEIVNEDRSGIGKNSYVKQFAERPRLTGVAIVPENDAAPEARSVPTSAQITGQRRGLRSFLTFAADMVSIESELIRSTDLLMEAYLRNVHAEILALFTLITAGTGTNATVHDLLNWDTVTALFRNDNHSTGKLWAVQHSDATRDLRTDLRTNAAALFGTSFGEAEARAVLNQTSGLGVNFDGYMLHETNSVPAGDTTGHTNMLGVNAGEDSALEVNTYDSMAVKAQEDKSRYGVWLVVGGIYGVGVKRQGSGRRYITQT